jgi:lysophospholipase L1-like esterase
MSIRMKAVLALTGCALLAGGPGMLKSQEAGPAVLAAGRSADPPPPPVSNERIRRYIESSRGSLEHPEELVSFFERLHRISTESHGGSAHILHFGDSHTAGDEWTAPLRSLFQQRFGDGGSGFSLAGHPFAGYRRLDAPGGWSAGWKAEGLNKGPGDGLFGLGGVSIATDRAGQSVYLNADCDVLEIHYLRQPNGGSVALYQDDRLLEEFSTAGSLHAEVHAVAVGPGAHRFLLKTTGAGPVRLFGWVADRQRGVTYEALGLNGVRASVMLNWDEEMLASYLKRRDPALIVLAYGTNEAVDLQSAEHYHEIFSTLLSRLRRMAPRAAILVVGPPDIYPRMRGGSHSSAEVERVIAAQQNACRENGCAFWDMRQHMGGAGSIREWATMGYAQRDYIHLSASGYRQLGEALFADLMRYYETYERVRFQMLGRDNP